MNEYPPEFIEVFSRCAESHKEDVEEAISEAVRQIKALPNYKRFVDVLVRRAIAEGVYAARHDTKRRMTRKYKNRPIVASRSARAAEVERSVYDYPLGGTTMGEHTYETLIRVAQDEREIADGHLFQARLAEGLLSLGMRPDTGAKVRDTVPVVKIHKLFRTLGRSIGEDAA